MASRSHSACHPILEMPLRRLPERNRRHVTVDSCRHPRSLGASCEGRNDHVGRQPFITSDMLNSIIDVFYRCRKAQPYIRYAASTFRNITGPPVLFSHDAFPDLLQLEGDTGAKQMLKRMPGVSIEFRDRTLFYDVDTRAQYDALLPFSLSQS